MHNMFYLPCGSHKIFTSSSHYSQSESRRALEPSLPDLPPTSPRSPGSAGARTCRAASAGCRPAPPTHLQPRETPPTPGSVGSSGGGRINGMANAFACPSILTAAQGGAASSPAVEGTGTMGNRQHGGLTLSHQAQPDVPKGDLCCHLAFCSHRVLIGVSQPEPSGTSPCPLTAFVVTHVLRCLCWSYRSVQRHSSSICPLRPSIRPAFPSHPPPSQPVPTSPRQTSGLRCDRVEGQHLLVTQRAAPKPMCQIQSDLLTHNYFVLIKQLMPPQPLRITHNRGLISPPSPPWPPCSAVCPTGDTGGVWRGPGGSGHCCRPPPATHRLLGDAVPSTHQPTPVPVCPRLPPRRAPGTAGFVPNTSAGVALARTWLGSAVAHGRGRTPAWAGHHHGKGHHRVTGLSCPWRRAARSRVGQRF